MLLFFVLFLLLLTVPANSTTIPYSIEWFSKIFSHGYFEETMRFLDNKRLRPMIILQKIEKNLKRFDAALSEGFYSRQDAEKPSIVDELGVGRPFLLNTALKYVELARDAINNRVYITGNNVPIVTIHYTTYMDHLRVALYMLAKTIQLQEDHLIPRESLVSRISNPMAWIENSVATLLARIEDRHLIMLVAINSIQDLDRMHAEMQNYMILTEISDNSTSGLTPFYESLHTTHSVSLLLLFSLHRIGADRMISSAELLVELTENRVRMFMEFNRWYSAVVLPRPIASMPECSTLWHLYAPLMAALFWQPMRLCIDAIRGYLAGCIAQMEPIAYEPTPQVNADLLQIVTDEIGTHWQRWSLVLNNFLMYY